MSKREDLKTWVIEALQRNGGEALLIDIAKDIWAHRSDDLKASGDLFYTWQYDMRWAGTALRKQGVIEDPSVRGKWKLVAGR